MPRNHVTGADDSREEALAYMTALSGGRADAEQLARFVDEGPDILAGLEKRSGARFAAISWPDYHPEMDGARPTGRMVEPTLYDTARLGDWAKRLRRAPVLGLPLTLQESTVDWSPSYTPERYDGAEIKRRVAEGLVACGQSLVGGLLEGCLARGIEPILEARALELIVRDGAVAGLVVEREGRRVDIDAGAVILASGGYEWNSELRSRFLPGPLTHPTSPPGNEGDGLLMAMEVGADLANMNEAWWYPAGAVPGDEYEGRQLSRFVAVERTAPHSIMVDRFGHRFVNEAANYNDMQKAFFAFDANDAAPRHLPCWVVFDKQYRDRYPVLTVRPGAPDPEWLLAHDTLEGLAAAAGIDPVGLADSVQRWNGFVADGRDRDYGRGDSLYDRFHGDPTAPHPNLGTLERPPYYALPVHLGAAAPGGLLGYYTPEGLAGAAGIDPVGLADSVQRWNGFVADGRDRDYGRGDSLYDRFHGDPTAPHPNLGTLERPPYYALPVHLGAVGTSGGPRVDLNGQVQHVRDRPIPGLYGAGNAIASPD